MRLLRKLQAKLKFPPLRVLICPEDEDGSFSAHALELDIVGAGSTPEEAVADLKAAVGTQLLFATEQGDWSILDFPAGESLFERWNEAQREGLRRLQAKEDRSATTELAMVIEVEPPALTGSRPRFETQPEFA